MNYQPQLHRQSSLLSLAPDEADEVPGFEAPGLRRDRTCTNIAREQRATADRHLTQLNTFFRTILTDREDLSREAQDTLVRWREETLERLEDTDQSPGFNLYHEENWKVIKAYFTNLSQAKTKNGKWEKIVQKDQMTKDYEVSRIMRKLKLRTPYDVRKSEFRKLTDNIVGLVVTSRMDMERLTFFGHTWHDPIFNAVKSDRRNFENTDRWLRVQVVLEYIHAITKHKFDAEEAEIPMRSIPRDQREKRLRRHQDQFLEEHKPVDVLAMMGIEIVHAGEALPAYEAEETAARPSVFQRLLRRTRNAVTPGSHDSSSQASLNHSRRLGLRQIQMRGLVPLGKAEDGGYYF